MNREQPEKEVSQDSASGREVIEVHLLKEQVFHPIIRLNFCKNLFLLKQHLTRDCFFDPYQLDSLFKDSSVIKSWHTTGFVEVEADAESETSSEMTLSMDIESDSCVEIDIPFHMRYQRAKISDFQGRSFKRIDISCPSILNTTENNFKLNCAKSMGYIDMPYLNVTNFEKAIINYGTVAVIYTGLVLILYSLLKRKYKQS